MKHRIALAAAVLAAAPAFAQTDFSKVEVKTTPLGHGLAMLAGAGGNMVASAGEDGVFIVDDEFADLHPKIKEALAQMSDRPVRFVINTHWHGDHTGGNEKFAGDGAVVIAQDNVYRRMSTSQFIKHLNRTVPASPKGALPVVTFNDQATLHLNGDEIRLVHIANAHTDGDVLVHFPGADVLHMGDCFFNGQYPIIDTGTGGTIDGYVAAVEKGLSLAGPATKIVPGHGPLGDRAQLAAFGEMLRQAREAVAKLKNAGKSLEETQAAKPTAALDATWAKGFVKPEAFVRTIFETLPSR
ncbi:MAG TPA: MBL fold metallo-hydrolase [Thermoanaerobaculia bacterium]|nr:MBL fold metallo-hydrolase [Thermoanaerobaculia bacterium]